MTDDYDFVPGVGYAPWGPEPTEQIEAVSIPKVKRWRVWGSWCHFHHRWDWYVHPTVNGKIAGEPEFFTFWRAAFSYALEQARAER